MTVKDCAKEADRSEQTVRLWVKKGELKAKKHIRELTISKKDWQMFCEKKGIKLDE